MFDIAKDLEMPSVKSYWKLAQRSLQDGSRLKVDVLIEGRSRMI